LILKEWSLAGQSVDAAWRTADRMALEHTRTFLNSAWNAYYAFSFEKALELLSEAEKLMNTPGDSRFRSRMTFEMSVLEGMVRRAMEDGGYTEEFRRAAALAPGADLTPERYSPEIISAYVREREKLLLEDQITLTVEGSPQDAEILVDGKMTGSGGKARIQVHPGRHFIEAAASGYEPWSRILEVGELESPSVKFSLHQSGPEDEPGRFFLERFKADDRTYLSDLAGKLDVDYVLIPDGEGEVLRSWLIDRDGRSVAQATLWKSGEDPKLAVENISVMLEPLRMDRGSVGGATLVQMNLPPFTENALDAAGKPGGTAAWKRYAAVIGLLILAGVAAGSEGDGGGTRIEVTW
jgi:hypothetical protein